MKGEKPGGSCHIVDSYQTAALPSVAYIQMTYPITGLIFSACSMTKESQIILPDKAQ
jgi:hypothetical protein